MVRHLKPGCTTGHAHKKKLQKLHRVQIILQKISFIWLLSYTFSKRNENSYILPFPVHGWICSHRAINIKAKGAFEIISDTLYFDCKASKVTNFLIISWKEMFQVFLLQFTHIIVPHREEGSDLQQRTVKAMANTCFRQS